MVCSRGRTAVELKLRLAVQVKGKKRRQQDGQRLGRVKWSDIAAETF